VVSEEEDFPHAVRELDVASSFDFARQAALYIPSHLPDPREDAFADGVADELARLCQLTEGRAFALFTSRRNMERVFQRVQGRLPYPLLLQGERPKGVLLDAFRRKPSVLFATHSFWEGVDVAGEALSLVIMDKLPFSAPGDPLVAARVERLQGRGEDPFVNYQLPEAAIALRQGFGRLIRTRRDHGVVAILDRRLLFKAYGQSLLAALPPSPVFRERRRLEDWWRRTRPSAER
jgi:ATP-dependent DNA helicase DinG